MNRTSACLAAAFTATLLALSVRAQQGGQPQAAQQPGPTVTFQTEVNYVDVDTIVTDAAGRFVGDLTKDDFQVFEDGKPQKVETFSTVQIPMVAQDRFLFMDRPVTTDVRSNREQFAGRVYVIVLDDFDISPMRTAQTRRAAREFVQKHFGANDIAAVIYSSGRTDATQEFTNDPQLLLAAIDKFIGRRLRPITLDRVDEYYQRLAMTSAMNGENTDDQSSTGPDQSISSSTLTPRATDKLDSNDFERGYRALGVLNTLKNLADFLSSVRGRRKAVLLFSEGIDYPITDVFGSHSAGDVIRALEDAISASARGNVNLFTIDPRGLVGMTTEFIEMAGNDASILPAGPNGSAAGSMLTPGSAGIELLNEMRMTQDSLRTLAEQTGGFASLNRNTFQATFDKIVDANSRYYVLGYYPPSHPRDGRFHKIEVRVRRPGLTVVNRRGYASPRGKTPEERRRDEEARIARENKNGSPNNTSPQLRDMLNSPMQQSGLTFTVQAAPFKNTGKEASVALAIEIDGTPLKFTPAQNGLVTDNIEVSFFGLNAEGKARQGVRSEAALTLRPETFQRVRANGFRLNSRIPLAPGRYQLRIGARETGAGATGTVFYDLTVPDFEKDPLMISGLLLSAPSADQTPTAQADPAVAKLLPGAPTSRREFVRSDVLTLLSELYDNSDSKQLRQIEVTVHLLGESGQEAFTAHDAIANGADGKKWDVYAYSKQIPLSSVAPGRYLLRVEAQVRGNQNGAKAVARETLITVR